MAVSALTARNFIDAEFWLQETLRVHSNFFEATLNLAQLYDHFGRQAEAITAYERAIAINPGHAAPFTRRAILLFRSKFGPPLTPRVVKESVPIISMNSIGTNGRFGNQLLQYAFLRIYAREHDLNVVTPDWIGRDLFDLDDPFPTQQLAHVDEEETDFFASLNRTQPIALANKDISGYFAGTTAKWSGRTAEFRSLFKPTKKIHQILDAALNEIRGAGRTLVAIHLRRGDFGAGKFWIAPTTWYAPWLETIWDQLESPILYIATDDSSTVADFAKFKPLQLDSLAKEIAGAEFYLDHFLLSVADHLAISNSSFSFTAAMLNERAATCMRPDQVQSRLVPFNPWNSAVLL